MKYITSVCSQATSALFDAKTWRRSLYGSLAIVLLLFNFSFSSYGQGYVTVGTQTGNNLSNPFATENHDSRYQYILTAAELTTAGLSANHVLSSISYNVSTAQAIVMNGLTVSIKHTGATTLANFDGAGLSQVYTGNFATTATGWREITFQNNFVWDGTSNLLIQVCFDNTVAGNSSLVTFRGTGANRAVFQRVNNDVGCNLTTATTSVNVPITRFYATPGLTPTLQNLSANATLSTSFAHRRGASINPKFTLSSNSSFNAVQIEMNHFSNFSGPALVSTINDGTNYDGGTPYDFWTTEDLTGDRTYFVRARVSSNGGGTWGAWTTQFWPYSYYPATTYPEEGWYFTTEEQFYLGTVDETLYNFISIQNNGTTYPDDDYFQLNQGQFDLTVSANGDQYLTEGTGNFSGAATNYITVGSYYLSGAQRQDYHGFRFTGFPVPNGASILTSNLRVYSHHTGSEPAPNNSNPLYLELVGVDQTNANAWANSTSTTTGGPRWRDRRATTIPWDITSSWTDLALMTSPDISSIIEDIVGIPGYNAGNAIAVIVDYTGGGHSSQNRHRYFTTGRRNVLYRPSIVGTFTNFYNTVRFPSVDRAVYGPDATAWDELRVTDDTQGCGTCYVEYRIHDAGTDAVLAGPFLRPAGMSGSQYFDISGVTTANIYVSTRVYRNSTPLVHDIWLTATEVSPLPVEWRKVEGQCFPDGNEIRWETATEQNNDYFTVERSTDGVSWANICQISGAGNSNTPNSYICFDPSKRAAIYYYRVRQTDFDGETKVSDVISVNCDEKSELLIYPNPNQGQFILDGGRLGMNVVLYDPTGRIIMMKPITNQSTEFDISTYTKGLYLLEVKENDTVQTFKIVVN